MPLSAEQRKQLQDLLVAEFPTRPDIEGLASHAGISFPLVEFDDLTERQLIAEFVDWAAPTRDLQRLVVAANELRPDQTGFAQLAAALEGHQAAARPSARPVLDHRWRIRL